MTRAKLNKKHMTDLARSGIKASVADRCAFASLSDGDGYAIPYFDLDGKRTDFARFRFFDGDRKYIQRANTAPQLYFPPYGKKRRHWRAIASDTSKRVRVTEGEKKAVAATLSGLNCIGLGGKDSWQSGGVPLPEWSAFKWKGRKVELVPDSDQSTNADVRRSFIELGDYLASLGADVSVRELPTLTGSGKTGLDDYLVAEGKAAFKRLPVHSLNSPYIKRWRDGIAKTGGLPEFSLQPVSAAWAQEKPQDPRYLINGLIPAGVVALIVGPGGVGKTYLTMWMAMSVACGARFLGLPTARGRVLYLALEDPPEVLRHRYHWVHRKYSKQLTRAALEENFVIDSLLGQQLHLVTMKQGVAVQSPQLLPLIERLKQYAPSLIVLDPMARLHGADENANATGTALINAAERIARDVGCTVVLSHHTGKQSASTKNESAYAARGASGIADAARVILNLYPVEADASGRVVITQEDAERGVLKLIHAKNNYGPKFKDTWLRRTDHGVLEQFTPEHSGSAEWLKKLRVWTKKYGTEFTITKLRDRHKELGFVSRRTAVAVLRQAIESGELEACESRRGGGQLYRIADSKGENK